MLKVYSDGGSRGNPGPSAYAFKILKEDNEVLKRGHDFLGKGTNNQAEYEALITTLECASRSFHLCTNQPIAKQNSLTA